LKILFQSIFENFISKYFVSRADRLSSIELRESQKAPPVPEPRPTLGVPPLQPLNHQLKPIKIVKLFTSKMLFTPCNSSPYVLLYTCPEGKDN